jgi:hypothetical protein
MHHPFEQRAMVLLPVLNVFSQEMGSGRYREGYGSYGTMGQNPDDLMKYSRDMTRYANRLNGIRLGQTSIDEADRPID